MEYTNVSDKLRWYVEFLCDKGHCNRKRLDDLFNTWCPRCCCNTIEDAHKLASKMKGKFLSTEYTNSSSKYEWECENGHQFKSKYTNVTSGKWCKQCLCLSFDQMTTLAEKKGGKCLTVKEEITGSLSSHKFLWECKQGHQWRTTYGSVKNGSWCGICNETINERTCRKIFEFIFNKQFPKRRPGLLKHKNNLELDGYCEELKLAFEYNGEQHYRFIDYFHKTQERFEDDQERDRVKNRLCEENDVQLITIPYTVKYLDLYSFIIEQCIDTVGIPLDTPSSIDYKVLNLSSLSDERLEEIQSYLDEKWTGSKVTSTLYVNNTTSLDFICSKGHSLQQTWGTLISGSFCKQCTYGGVKEKMQERLDTFCLDNKLDCLDKYDKAKTPMRWRCDSCSTSITRSWDSMSKTPHSCQKVF